MVDRPKTTIENQTLLRTERVGKNDLSTDVLF